MWKKLKTEYLNKTIISTTKNLFYIAADFEMKTNRITV